MNPNEKSVIGITGRDELWRFLTVAHGVNVSIHHNIHSPTAEFTPEAIELGKGQFNAQVFKGMY